MVLILKDMKLKKIVLVIIVMDVAQVKLLKFKVNII